MTRDTWASAGCAVQGVFRCIYGPSQGGEQGEEAVALTQAGSQCQDRAGSCLLLFPRELWCVPRLGKSRGSCPDPAPVHWQGKAWRCLLAGLPPSPLPCCSWGLSSWAGCESGARAALLGRVAGRLVNTAKAVAGGLAALCPPFLEPGYSSAQRSPAAGVAERDLA